VPGQHIGSVVAAAFGLVYVEVNAGQLPPAACWTLRALAPLILIAIGVLALAARRRRGTATSSGHHEDGSGGRSRAFGRRYWLIVLIEFAAIFAGARILSGPLERSYAGVAWVSLVVGIHFFFLAGHFRLRFFQVLGTAITACGAVGLVLAFATGSAPAVALVSGVVPGFILLGFASWGVSRRPRVSDQTERSRADAAIHVPATTAP
jgi:hypothetical protein